MQNDLQVWDFALIKDEQMHTLLSWQLARGIFRVSAKGYPQGKPTIRITYETWLKMFAP